ncbi:MAG: aminotransferase class III-fold pyridoxal phosphate-dependent enzyme [Planctomycetes bacterium]|nr:aminotransferase class III-fold pyridoxal phosphate-dependent enzyme [Planctomycetota bacterium]
MTSHTTRLEVTPEMAARLARANWNLDGEAHELDGERDRNFELRLRDGARYVMKFAHSAETRERLEAQELAMQRVARHAGFTCPSPCPVPLPTTDGATIHAWPDAKGNVSQVRVLTWLDGLLAHRHEPRDATYLESLGAFVGELVNALAGFEHAALDDRFHWNLVQAVPQIERGLATLVDVERRSLLERVLRTYRESIPALESALPRQTIHGDVNDHNLLVSGAVATPWAVTGVIDFGDMGTSWRIAELAIAAAYAVLDANDPLASLRTLVAHYARHTAITNEELEALFPLVTCRLAMSVSLAAIQRRAAPDNAYLSVTEESAWRTLQRLDSMHARLALAALRDAVGRTPCPNGARLTTYVQTHASELIPPVPLDPLRTHVLDLSVGSSLVASLVDERRTTLEHAIHVACERAGATRALGRWNEARMLYTSEAFTNQAGEPRTIHLGVDVFAPAGTPVQAPLRGTVHTLADNAGHLDYGPTVILKHEVEEAFSFYSLYGHLDPDCLEHLHVGQALEHGTVLGTIGSPPRNGDWPPHLHFQWLADDLDTTGDYPGVASPSQRSLWTSLCPDPTALFRLDASSVPRETSKTNDLHERRSRTLGPSLSLSYRTPLLIVRGRGTHLFDADGRAYLDTVNNVCHVGHAHPHVVEAAARQMRVLNTNTRYLHDAILEYAERLTALFPAPLDTVFFVCSGSEANELALRLARTATHAEDVLVLDGAYHGNTQALIDVSPYKHAGQGGRGAPPWVHVQDMPDPYRGRFRGRTEHEGRRYALQVRETLQRLERAGKRPAAFLHESILSCGGQIVLPAGYLREAYAHVRAHGGLCIADEVQVGFGRVGTHLWAFETQGVVPDIVTLGKPIGNGHPLAAVITTRRIAEAFDNGMEYFNTFGGNPVSCAVGSAVLDVIEREDLQRNALEVGKLLKLRLTQLSSRHALIGDVRGLGLFLGVEFVRDRETLEPADRETSYIVERMKSNGILASVDGPLHDVIKIKPPLTFSRDDAERYAATLDAILAESPLRTG